MRQQEIVGLVLVALGMVDTAIGHLLIVPRVKDAHKQLILRVSFALSGILIVALGVAVYKSWIVLG